MEQKLIVSNLIGGIDMGVNNNGCTKTTYTLSELTENAKITVGESWGQPNSDDAFDTVHIVYEMNDVHLTDEKMEFTFMGDRYTLNRQWQVLGTISFGIPNAYIDISERFIFYFGTESGEIQDLDEQLQALYDEMYNHGQVGDFWKNIPLARKALQLMKDCDTERDYDTCHDFCEAAITDKLLNPLDTPRLILSLMDFQHVLLGSDYKWDEEAYKLRLITNPHATEKDIEAYFGETRMIKYDPIQLSQQWEDNIYEVEKELDKQFKNVDRHMGFCHRYWPAKRAALAKRGITWRTPQEMNPKTRFD